MFSDVATALDCVNQCILMSRLTEMEVHDTSAYIVRYEQSTRISGSQGGEYETT
jgi:hypothetical protein